MRKKRMGYIIAVLMVAELCSGCQGNVPDEVTDMPTVLEADTSEDAEIESELLQYEDNRDKWQTEMDGYIKNLAIIIDMDDVLQKMDDAIEEKDIVACEECQQTMQELSDRAGQYHTSAMLARKQYAEILDILYYQHKIPHQMLSSNIYTLDEYEWRFAFCDVDFDDREEMVLDLKGLRDGGTSFSAVYGYDEENDTVYEEFSGVPRMCFYDNGILLVDEPSSGTWEEQEYSPQLVYQYNAEEDAYIETDYYWVRAENSRVWTFDDGFPEDMDDDGDGIVYYMHNHDGNVGKEEYERWHQETFGDAYELELPWQPVSIEYFQSYLPGEDV
mgnify:CR=1 FL=1